MRDLPVCSTTYQSISNENGAKIMKMNIEKNLFNHQWVFLALNMIFSFRQTERFSRFIYLHIFKKNMLKDDQNDIKSINPRKVSLL